MYLLGLEAEEEARVRSWWEDAETMSRGGSLGVRASLWPPRLEQAEFWGREAAVKRTLPAEEPGRTEAGAPVSPTMASRETDVWERGDGNAVPQQEDEMSSFRIAKFLQINGSVRSGKDHGRWLALPGRRRNLGVQLMERPMLSDDYMRDLRAPPRDFSSLSPRQADGFLAR